MARLAGAQGVRWYKKIDSTLRGNIGAELDAMLDGLAESGALTAIISPAFPAQRRGVEDGYLVHAGTAAHRASAHALAATEPPPGDVRRATDGARAAGCARRHAPAAAGRGADAGCRRPDRRGLSGDLCATLGLNDVLFCGSAGLSPFWRRIWRRKASCGGMAIGTGDSAKARTRGCCGWQRQRHGARRSPACATFTAALRSETGGTASVVDSAASLDAGVAFPPAEAE